ncbi:MAG: HEAT repeat domain-containing protein [Gemmatimonadaceae bacterium]
MERIPTFATEFAQLLWQLARTPHAVEAQKATLRRIMLARPSDKVEIELGGLNFWIVGSHGVSEASESVRHLSELTMRMAAHAVRSLQFSAHVPAAEVLGVARALAAAPQLRDDGEAFDARMVALKPTGVTVTMGRQGFVRHATPRAGMRSIRPATPASGTRPVSSAAEAGPARLVDRLQASGPRAAGLSPRSSADSAGGESAARKRTAEDERLAIMSRELARTEPMQDLTALQALIGEASDANSAAAAADVALRAAEQRIAQGDWLAALGIIAAMAHREVAGTDADVRRPFLIVLRRLLVPHTLHGLAKLLPTARERRADLHSAFARSGEDGVDVLVELLTNAGTPGERRAYRDALAGCSQAAPSLQHMLGDTRWFAVRNAAELLGEMGVQEADAKLVETLAHPETRVRRAVTGALARLGTPRALHALQQMLRDANPAVRSQAALGLGAAAQSAATAQLIAALDAEQDGAVQQALVSALGRMSSPAAVERLAQAAQPGTLFRRRASGPRVAAVNALAEASTPEALETLRRLARDRDEEVRAAVERALREKSAL